MKSYTEKLHAELQVKLDVLNSNYNPQHLVDCRLQIISNTIDKIKEKLKKYMFKNIQEEVCYFKDVLPHTLSMYFYYKDKMEWDRIALPGTDDARFKYHDRIFSQAENFRTEHKTFCEYYRDGKTEYDSFYFLCSSPVNGESKYNLRSIIDPSTPPLYCELLAKYIAYNGLEYESKNIIAGNHESLHSIKSKATRLKWTGKIIELTELGNGLFETGSFNDGDATKKEIFDYLEEVFDVKLGNHYRAFHDMVRRKGTSTAFLDHMKEKLLYRIDIILN